MVRYEPLQRPYQPRLGAGKVGFVDVEGDPVVQGFSERAGEGMGNRDGAEMGNRDGEQGWGRDGAGMGQGWGTGMGRDGAGWDRGKDTGCIQGAVTSCSV